MPKKRAGRELPPRGGKKRSSPTKTKKGKDGAQISGAQKQQVEVVLLPPAPSVSVESVLSFLVVLVPCCMFGWYLYTEVLPQMFDQRFTWSKLTPRERRLSRATYSESSLYYTFLEEYAQAETFGDAVYGALRDNKTEYPEVINPLSRFNIWQEILIGQLWRSSQAAREAFPDPIDLMLNSIWAMQMVNFVGMGLLAWVVGGQNFLATACAFVALGIFSSFASQEKMNGYRAVQFPMLRENYSTPFMWYQLAGLVSMLRSGDHHQPRGGVRALLFVGSSLMLTAWQFAPFLLLLQVASLLATYIAGYASWATITRISRVIGAAMVFVGAIVTMGNVMLLTAPAIFIITGIHTANSRGWAMIPSPNSAATLSCSDALSALLKRVTLVLSVVVAAFTAKFFIMTLLGMQDDAHIMNILKFKLSGFSSAYEDFQTLLYVCSGAYQVVKWEDIMYLQNLEAIPGRSIALLVAVALLAAVELRKTRPQDRALDPGLVFVVANGILLAGLLCLIQRLSSVGVPFLCIAVAQMASANHVTAIGGVFSLAKYDGNKRHPMQSPEVGAEETAAKTTTTNKDQSTSAKAMTAKKSTKRGSGLAYWALLGLGLALSATLCQQAYNSFESAIEVVIPKMVPPPAARISNDMKAADRLINFVETSIPPTAALGGDAPILSRIRLMNHRPILNHPHAEHKARRIREERLYQAFNKLSEREVWQRLRELKVDYFVFSLGPCNLQCTLPDGRHFDMVYLVNSTNSLGEPGQGRDGVEQFCFYVYTQQHFLTYFELVHDNMPFWVAKVLNPDEVEQRKAYWKKKREEDKKNA